MEKYTAFIISNKKFLTILFVLINIIAFIGVLQIRFNTDFSMFAPEESIYEDRLDSLEDSFGELNQIIVLVEHDLFNEDTISDLRLIQEKLELMDNINFVQGVAPEFIPVNGVNTPILDIPSESLLEFYDSFEEFSPLIIDENIYFSTFTVFISSEFGENDISLIEDILDDSGYSSYISGDSYNQLKITDYIIRILLLLPPLTILIILLVFRWQMGSLKPTLLSILPAAMGSLWTFGLIGWIGNEVNILTAIVPVLIIVIGSADGLHFMSHFQDSKIEGKDNPTSLTSTLTLVGIPMIVTTLTSMVGFISLLTMKTDSVFDLAVYSSIGILFAGLATWYVLPLLLAGNIDILPKNTNKKRLDLSKYVKKLWGTPSLTIVGVILVITSFSFSNINNEFNMLMIYKNYTVVNKNAVKIEEVNGGSIPIYVTVELDSTPLSIDSLNEVNNLTSKLNSLDEVNKIINPYNFIKLSYNMNVPGDIPNDLTLSNIYSSISSDENSIINNLISEDNNLVRLLVFPSDLNNDTLTTIENTVSSSNETASVTGVQYLMKDLNVNISEMQVNSILFALVMVFIMLIVTLKSFRIAFYSLLPILITVVALYGFLGISSIPLNITTVIIFSITIGVGIDYAVHFSSVYKYFLKETNDNALAIDKAYKNSSRPIITNALGISLGLSILMLSPLTIHLNVSILMWVSMSVSVLVTLTLLPYLFSLKKQ